MRRLSGAILLSMSLCVLPWGVEKAFAADFAVPHTFNGGGVVSADELNERFDNLEQQQRDFVATDLVGTWNCPVLLSSGPAVGSSYSYMGWTVSGDGLTYSNTMFLTFTQSSGTLYLTASLAVGICGGPIASPCNVVNAPVKIVNGTFLSPYGSIRKRSNTRFEISTIITLGGAWAACDKQNIPPLKPSNLAANVSGTSITLTWTDNSSDETGFDILRKDAVSGTYSVAGTVGANTVTYTNTPVTSGTHWYRVVAKNANGPSLGSNVIKVTN